MTIERLMMISNGKAMHPTMTKPMIAAIVPKKPPARMAGIGMRATIPTMSSLRRVGQRPVGESQSE